jgi:guanylate kinase
VRAVVLNMVKQGKEVILDIDWQGAHAIKEQIPEAVSVFILPPTREVLRARLEGRGQDGPEVIGRRMREAVSEMRHYQEFDHVIVNDNLEAALNDLHAIIEGKPEKIRPMRVDIGALLAE